MSEIIEKSPPPTTQAKGTEYDIWNNVMRRATYNNGYAYGVLDFHCETGTNNYCKVTINKPKNLQRYF